MAANPSPTPTKRKPPRIPKTFELTDLDFDMIPPISMRLSSPAADRSAMLMNNETTRGNLFLSNDQSRGNVIKEELFQIVIRERENIEDEYATKIQNLLQAFKEKKMEWEDLVKEEREDLEIQFEKERTEMHQAFAQEIAKMTRNFEEERREMNIMFEGRLQAVHKDVESEKHEFRQNTNKDVENYKLKIRNEYEDKLAVQKLAEKKDYEEEIKNMGAKYEIAKKDLEKKYERQIEGMETKQDKELFEMERKFKEGKIESEREFQRRFETADLSLRKETYHREEVERVAATEKLNIQAINSMLKEEINRLKEEIERLKKQPAPAPEVRIIEKEVATEPLMVSYKTRNDLPLSLRDDFDRILNGYKDNLKDKFKKDSLALEEKLEMEKEKLKERINRQKEELDKRLCEEKCRLERDFDRSREDIEKEIERRLRTKQLQQSLTDQQKRFDDVTRRLSEEERMRMERMQESKYDSNVLELTRENEGLKLKVKALEDNNHVLKNLKEEGQEEVERLRNAVEELKTVVEMKRESERVQADYPSLIMSLMQQQQQNSLNSPVKEDTKNEPSVMERKKLEQLRDDLQQKEKDMRDRKNIEDAAKMALDQSQEKYDSLLTEKNRLDKSLKLLENRVVNMQDEFLKLKMASVPPIPNSTVLQPQNIGMYPPSSEGFLSAPSPLPITPHTPVQPVILPPADQNERIFKLKYTKERLTTQIEDLKCEMKDLTHANTLLERQIRDQERQIERYEDALEREKEISSNLREMLTEEKNKVSVLKEEKENEIKNCVKVKHETEDSKLKLELEIQELKAKLQHASQTLAAVRKQASDDFSSSYLFQGDHDGMVGVTKQFSQVLASALPNQDRRQYLQYGITKSNNNIEKSNIHEEVDRVKRLEKDKIKLETELNDAKDTLNNYTGRLENQLRSLEYRIMHQSKDQTNKRPQASKTIESSAQDSHNLRMQKAHLQKLIERLTAMNP